MRTYLLFLILFLPFFSFAQTSNLDTVETNILKLSEATTGAVLESDSLVLVALYNATDGPNWTQKYNWLTGPVSTWFGVGVSGDRVLLLLLDDNNLVGTIPSELGDLTNLHTLQLQENTLSGNIPTSIENLSNLNYLYLSSNNLEGSIPTSMGNLTNLRYLALNSNELSGSIPDEIGDLTKLEELYLNGNSLNGQIPATIGDLVSLENLSLNSNSLSGTIPSTIGNLVNLDSFDFSENEIDSIPPTMINLTTLYTLWANNNYLTFEDLYHLPSRVNYAPQNIIPINTTINVEVGIEEIISLPFDNGVFNSTYTWSRNGVFYATTTENRVAITENTASTTANYTVSITNTDFPELTLQAESIEVISSCNTVSEYYETACYSITLNGVNYTESGTFIQILTNAAGCDSTLTLHLTINQSTEEEVFHTACDSYTLNGVTYFVSGTFVQILTNDAGCEHRLTLHLTINESTAAELIETACESFTLNGVTYSESGTFIQNFTTAAGCDSTLTLHLTINQRTEEEIIKNSCGSYTLNGITYSESGTYIQIMTNDAGCEHKITLHLTVNENTAYELTETACDSYELNGITYSESGTFIQNLSTVAGCDSTLTLNLTIKESSGSEITETSCEYIEINGITYTESGTYTQTLTNAVGCDSTLTLYLTVNAIDNSVTHENETLTANQTNASYQWVDCNNSMSPIAGESNQSFTASVNGSYAVVISKDGCYDVSDCYTIISTDIGDIDFGSSVSVYPNPTKQTATIDLGYFASKINIQVKNISGQSVFEDEYTSKQKFKIELPELTGVYFIQIIADGKSAVYKIIKN